MRQSSHEPQRSSPKRCRVGPCEAAGKSEGDQPAIQRTLPLLRDGAAALSPVKIEAFQEIRSEGRIDVYSWKVPLSRPTKDIDLLGRLNNNIENIVAVMQDVCGQSVEPDGFDFDPRSIEATNIVEYAEYGGIRVIVKAKFLANAKVLIQLDIGFGDVIVPNEISTTYPTILDFPAPILKGYSMESAIAEKFDAMAHRGMVNSRMKDFFDIWFLSRNFAFGGAVLADAIAATFENRGRAIRADPVCFSAAFAKSKDSQWQTFLRRGRLKHVLQDFQEIVSGVAAFLKPIAIALSEKKGFKETWKPNGPWM